MFNFFKKFFIKKREDNTINTNSKNYDETINNSNKFKTYTARCPKCGNLLTENNDYLECIDIPSGACNFKINRIINGKKITLEMFADFQNIPGVNDAYNIVNSERDKLIKRYEREDEELHEKLIKKDTFFKDARKLKKLCPIDYGNLYRKNDTVKCGDCDFTINTLFCGVNFSDDEIDTMLPYTISNEHIFLDKNGKSIKTVAFLDFNESGKLNGKFKLARNLSEMEERYLKVVRVYPEGKENSKKPITLEEYLIKNDEFFKAAKQTDLKCPNHLISDVKLYKKDDVIRCNKCQFTMNTSFCGVNFSNDEIKNMLTRTISNEHIFIDENGKSIKTVAFLDFDENGKRSGGFKLAIDPLKMEEHHLKFIYIYPEGIQNRTKWIRLEEYLKKQKK